MPAYRRETDAPPMRQFRPNGHARHMSYYMVRLYSGSSDRSPEQLLRDVTPKILPKLQEAGGWLASFPLSRMMGASVQPRFMRKRKPLKEACGSAEKWQASRRQCRAISFLKPCKVKLLQF